MVSGSRSAIFSFVLPEPADDELPEEAPVPLLDVQPAYFGDRLPHAHVVIDHHSRVGAVESDYCDLRPQYGATSTILTEYLEACGADVSQRLALYKRLAEIERPEEVVDARAELTDRYGPLPPAVEGLLDVIGLRVAARELGVERVEAGGGRAVLTFAPSTKVTPERLLKAIATSRGGLALKKEYTVEARIPTEPWPAVRDALAKLLDSLR